MSFNIVAIFALVLGLMAYLTRYARMRKRMKGAVPPPGPRGLPILGNAIDLVKDPYLVPTFNKWREEYGPIFGFSVMGQRHVVVSDEKMVRDLFARRGDIYSDRGRSPAIDIIANDAATFLLDKNDTWRRQRRGMQLALTLADGSKFEPFTDIESKYTLRDLVERPQDFDDHFARYAFGTVARSSVGHYTSSVQDPFYLRTSKDQEFIVNAFRPDKYLCNVAPFLLKLPSWLWKERAVLYQFRDYVWGGLLEEQNKLRELVKQGTAPLCFQTKFLENQDEYAMSDLEGVAIFSAFLGAGTRSPHNAMLSFTIAMLQHPEWLAKLQKHVDEVVGTGRLPRFSDIPSLPMVRAAVMETLRHRTVHADIGVPHKLSQDDVFEGYFFEKGSLIHANLSAILQHPELYPDGDTFNPARWLDPSYPTYREPLTQYPKVRESAGFGVGRRACPGAPFTERSLTIMVARLVWACNIRRTVDPVTGALLPLDIKYEPVVNPRPYRFPATFEPRSAERSAIVVREANAAKLSDPIRKKDQ